MECVKCGRRYDDKLKVCPYCGGAKKIKRQTIEDKITKDTFFEEERILNGSDRRRRDRARREHLKQQKKRRIAKQRRMFLMMLIVVVLGVIIYGFVSKKSKVESEPTSTPTVTQNATQLPDDTQNTKKVSSKTKNKKSDKSVKDMSSECTNFINKDKGIDVPYPNEMTKTGENNDKTQKSIKTESGDASMVISAERIGQDSDVNQLLNKYREGIGVNESDAQIDPEGEYYSLDFVRSGEVKHRFGIIKNGYHIYYDFTYDEDSDGISRYKNYISYIDDYMMKTISGTIEIEDDFEDDSSDDYDDSDYYDDDDEYDDDYE